MNEFFVISAYHSKCIDPWLTKKRRVCPVCKRKVFASGETVADFDSETEDETTPLVRNTGNGTTNAGTFARFAVNFFTSVINSIIEFNLSRLFFFFFIKRESKNRKWGGGRGRKKFQ